MAYISSGEAAKRLGISEADVSTLVRQEILRPAKEAPASHGHYLFAEETIERIASNKDPSLSEEAALVGVQIQQEVVYAVSALQSLRRRVSVFAGAALVCFVLAVIVVAALFRFYPRQMSDFFGYYYRYNAGNQSALFDQGATFAGIFGADAVPVDTTQNVSLAASITKPVAAMSLLVIKAADGQQYDKIVQAPAAVASGAGPAGTTGQPGINGLNGPAGLNGLNGQPGVPGATGATGLNGTDGQNGADGANGATGPPGVAGTNGINGIDGTNGIDGLNGTNGASGLNGTSVTDVTTTAGDIFIRDITNAPARLGAGSDGQVLTIAGGIPAWMNASGLTAETDTLASVTGRGASTNSLVTFGGGLTILSGSLSLPLNSIAIGALSSGDYSTKLTSGIYGIDIAGNAATATSSNLAITAANFSGSLSGDASGLQGATQVVKINGNALGLTTPSAGNLLIGNGSSWSTHSVSGDASITSGGVLTLQSVGTAGTYGSGGSIPILTTDSKGRLTAVSTAPVSGLTVVNFSSAGVAQFTNNAGYLAAESDTLASVTGRGASTGTALTLSSLSNDITAGTLRLNSDSITDLTGSGLSVSGGALNVIGLTNSNFSGSAGITNANLQNSAVTVNTSGPLTGGGAVSLGGSALTLGISSTPGFTTVNGLTITANSGNTLSIASGKVFGVSNSIAFTGTDGTTFSLPAASDTLVGRSSTDTLLNKVIAAGSNTISGLTNANLSGAAGITNANLANSGLSLSGNSGSGLVSLGGSLTITGSGITSITAAGSTLTVTTNEADTLASVTGRGATTSTALTFNGGLTFSGSVTFSGITSCRNLSTNASGVLQCGDTTGDGASFTDANPAAIADNDTTELFNDATKPSITPRATTQPILVSVHARFTGGGSTDTDTAVRIVRNIGSAANCSGSTQVGDTFSAFLTNSTDIQNTSGTFLDSPATTSQVFYTVCSSSDSRLGSTPSSNRIDVTLARIGR